MSTAVLRVSGDGGSQVHAAWPHAPTPTFYSVAIEQDLCEAARKAVLLALNGESQLRSTRLDIEVAPPLAQLRVLTSLPPVSQRDLVRLVREQRSRFFRPTNSSVHVAAARWLNRADRKAVAALADRSLLEALEEACAQAGVRLRGIFVTHPLLDAPLWLPTPRTIVRKGRRDRAAVVAALLIALLGWLAPRGLYLSMAIHQDQAVVRELSRLDSTLVLIDSLEARVDAFAPFADAFRRQGFQWATHTLNRIALELPPDLHLHVLSLTRDGSGSLSVHAEQGGNGRASVERLWPGAEGIEGTGPEGVFSVTLRPSP